MSHASSPPRKVPEDLELAKKALLRYSSEPCLKEENLYGEDRQRRRRKLTEKGAQWEEDRKQQHWRLAISSWKKHAAKLESLINDSEEPEFLKAGRNQLTTAMDLIHNAFEELETSNIIDDHKRQQLEEIETENLDLCRRTGQRIQFLDDGSSHRSSRASSHSSRASRRSRESTVESLKVKLKHSVLVEQQQQQLVKAKAELERLKLQERIELAEADHIHVYPQVNISNRNPLAKEEDIPPRHIKKEPTMPVRPKENHLKSVDIEDATKPSSTSNRTVASHMSGSPEIEALVSQLAVSRLPVPEPEVFDGSPLKYPGWKAAFKALIAHHNIPELEKLYYLRKYVKGSARECIEGCFMVNSSSSFEQAFMLLDERFGDSFTIASAFRDKLSAWPRIQGSDGKALQRYADYLQQCAFAKREYSGLSILDDEMMNRSMLQKCPDWIVTRWARIVMSSKESKGRYPPFEEFVKFIAREAKIACDPVTSLQALRPRDQKASTSSKPKQRNSTSFVNSTTQAKKSDKEHPAKKRIDQKTDQKTDQKSTEKTKACPCKKHIDASECEEFLKMSLDKRETYVKENDLCFKC